MAAGCGLAIMRLHICRKSEDQYSIGPNGVDDQSTLLANWIWRGRLSERGSRVQSKKPISRGMLPKGSMSPAAMSSRFTMDGSSFTDLFRSMFSRACKPLLRPEDSDFIDGTGSTDDMTIVSEEIASATESVALPK